MHYRYRTICVFEAVWVAWFNVLNQSVYRPNWGFPKANGAFPLSKKQKETRGGDTNNPSSEHRHRKGQSHRDTYCGMTSAKALTV